MRLIFPLIAVLFFGATLVPAQQSRITVQPFFPVDGNPPVAVDLPVPVMDAKSFWIAGVITVAVTVDEKGTVSAVDEGDGPSPFCRTAKVPEVLALRATSIAAAKKAVFKPATFEGKPVSVKGFLKYDFQPSPEATKLDPPAGLARVAAQTNPGRPIETGAASIVGSHSGTGSTEVLNGKAEALSKPSYPAAARAIRAGGTVEVQVIIAEDGTMYSAASISGHPLLRRASEVAACGSRFSPTLLSGQPVKVTGIITYNFVP